MSTETKSKDKRFDKIIFLMKKKFEQHKYYEGQQMLKTLYSRLLNQNKYDEASQLLSEGALILMGHKKTKESIEISNDLINLWKQDPSDKSLNTKRATLLHDLFSMIPAHDEQCINDFIRYVLEWIAELKKANKNHPQTLRNINTNMMPIYKTYGLNLWKMKHFYRASTALVRTKDIHKMVDLFAEWSQLSSSKESPYYITRIVLQYLCVGNVSGCRSFIQSVCPRDDVRGASYRHPLENFSDLLCESIERKSVVLYNVVVKTYEPMIKVDLKLLPLLQRAAHTCLGIPLPRNSGGLIGNLLSLLS